MNSISEPTFIWKAMREQHADFRFDVAASRLELHSDFGCWSTRRAVRMQAYIAAGKAEGSAWQCLPALITTPKPN